MIFYVKRKQKKIQLVVAKPVFPGRELLASHVCEGEAQHEGYQRVASVLLEGGHVFTQGVLVGA